MGTTEERSSRRPAAVLEPRGPNRVDAAGRLQPAAPPDRGVPGLAAPLDGPQPQGPGPHHTLAPEPNRCGAAPALEPDGRFRSRAIPQERLSLCVHSECGPNWRSSHVSQCTGLWALWRSRAHPFGICAGGFTSHPWRDVTVRSALGCWNGVASDRYRRRSCWTGQSNTSGRRGRHTRGALGYRWIDLLLHSTGRVE